MKIRITFFEEALGSTPAKEDLLREYIASKAPDAICGTPRGTVRRSMVLSVTVTSNSLPCI